VTRRKSSKEQEYAKKLGTWIREQRGELGVSLESFSEQLGVHRNTVWMWENGRALPNVYYYSLIKRRVSGVEVAQ
jgi:DNA-binding transcriptional regulator YiaG